MPASHVVCPHCQVVLHANRPLLPGKPLRCQKCGNAFAVSAKIPPPTAAPRSLPAQAVPVAAPFRAPPEPAVGGNGAWVAVLGSVALLVACGVGLAVYLLSGPRQPALAELPPPEPVVAAAVQEDKGAIPPAPAVPPAPAALPDEPSSDNPAAPAPVPVPEGKPAPAAQPAPPPVQPDPPLRPAPAPAAAALGPEQRVNAAIDRGVQFLRTSQDNNGRWDRGGAHPVGYAALPGLTLLECGVPATDPAVKRAAAFVRQQAKTLGDTYDLALAILFLDRLGDDRDRDLIQTLAVRLIAGQNATGGWTYKCPILGPPDHKHLLAFLRRHQAQPLQDLIAGGGAAGQDPLRKDGAGNLPDPLAKTPPGDFKNPLAKPGNPDAGNATPQPPPQQPGLLQPIDPGKTPLPPAPAAAAKEARPAETPALPPAAGPSARVFATAFLRGMTDAQLPKHLRPLPVVHLNKGTVVPPVAEARGLPRPVLKGPSGDNSNTQFAMLGLWVARRHAVPMERTLALIDHRFLSSQNADGGWGYGYRHSTTHTMTSVGLLGLAMGHGFAEEIAAAVKGKKDAKLPGPREPDPSIRRGLRKLGQQIGQPKEANLYFLWSVERVGVLYNLKTNGNKDWYAWASKILLARQGRDGSWALHGYHQSTATIDTCFALLILKRTNLVRDLTDNLRMLGIMDPDAERRSERR